MLTLPINSCNSVLERLVFVGLQHPWIETSTSTNETLFNQSAFFFLSKMINVTTHFPGTPSHDIIKEYGNRLSVEFQLIAQEHCFHLIKNWHFMKIFFMKTFYLFQKGKRMRLCFTFTFIWLGSANSLNTSIFREHVVRELELIELSLQGLWLRAGHAIW